MSEELAAPKSVFPMNPARSASAVSSSVRLPVIPLPTGPARGASLVLVGAAWSPAREKPLEGLNLPEDELTTSGKLSEESEGLDLCCEGVVKGAELSVGIGAVLEGVVCIIDGLDSLSLVANRAFIWYGSG